MVINELWLCEHVVYINHRPVFGLSFDKLRWAFEKLGVLNSDDGSLNIEHDALLDLLQTKGVQMHW